MNLEFLPSFVNRLEGFVEIIAEDKPSVAIYKIDGDTIKVFAFINRNEFSEATAP